MVCGLAWNALCFVFSTSLVTVVAATNMNTTEPVVDLGYAKYQGHLNAQTNITSFLSIRYAAPPLGKLRFQAPQAPLNQSGVQPATQNPPSCYETPWANGTTQISYYRQLRVTPAHSEDCLFLNVFVPGAVPMKPVAKGGLPVLVWIHGGGYGFGNAAQYNGANLVAHSLNTMLVVVIQYRLGAFGFLAGNEVKVHGALNAGLLDQDFALKWVQDYIGLFGGNRDHVTIWGESAGAGSVLQHIVAHGGNTQPPLFNAVITSSTYLPPQYDYNHRIPQSLYNQIAAKTGCASRADNFTCIQSVNASVLDAVNRDVAGAALYHTFLFVPVIDGTFIIERPTVTLARGQVNGQVLLAVHNQNEGATFVNKNYTLIITEYASQLFPDMPSTQIQEVANVYKGYGTEFEQAVVMIGDSLLACPTYYPLGAFAGRSWKGLFAVPPAYHANDAIYYFYSPGHHPPYDNARFITAFSESFMSLAKNYDVNEKINPTSITPFWNRYVVDETEMLFDRTNEGEPVVKAIKTDPALLARCAFWERMTNATGQ